MNTQVLVGAVKIFLACPPKWNSLLRQHWKNVIVTNLSTYLFFGNGIVIYLFSFVSFSLCLWSFLFESFKWLKSLPPSIHLGFLPRTNYNWKVVRHSFWDRVHKLLPERNFLVLFRPCSTPQFFLLSFAHDTNTWAFILKRGPRGPVWLG